VSHMVDCIKEVNTVVQIPTTTVRFAILVLRTAPLLKISVLCRTCTEPYVLGLECFIDYFKIALSLYIKKDK